MKKAIFLFLFFIFLPSFLTAQKPEDERRIEEEKRQSLRSTEAERYKGEQPSPELAKSIELGYFRELVSKRIAFNSDACKALVILLGVEDYAKDFDSQIAFLKKRDIIPKKIETGLNPNEPLRKGLAAYMFCQALGIKGGFWMRLFGSSQRYALKELVYEGILLPGAVNDIVSGKELVLILTKSADYITKTVGTQIKLKP